VAQSVLCSISMTILFANAAMEDFIGRGDRRIGAVIRRAWELGATNDSW